MFRTIFLVLGLSIIHQFGVGQNYFQGFAEEVEGKRFGYHSPFPDVNTCLLLRGQSDYAALEWKTEIVPDSYTEELVHFIWLFGMDVTSNPVNFMLSINDAPCIEFSSSKTSDLGERQILGKNGARLTLNVTMLDKYEDQMGFAILEIPLKSIRTGQPNLIKISTPTVDNNAWYMTFKTQVEEQITIYQNKVVAKKAGKLFHSVSVDFVHIGDPETATVRVGKIRATTTLRAGFDKLEMLLPMVSDTTELTAQITNGENKRIEMKFTLTPIREWEIYLVQHTHTDIGYTRPQTEILPEHLRYIDHALDFCDQTDGYPDAAKFRWTCETSWSVREYLKSRPAEQIERLLKRIQEGRIEATGMFLNYSETVDENALATQTRTLKTLKNSGIKVRTAMQNDVNGIAWSLVDYSQQTDLKYLTMGIHAHRARKPFDKPTSFWWQSPAGNRLLAYRSEHYQHANSLSLTTGQQDVFRNNLSQYLSGLEAKNYPYNKIALQFSGYVTDNSPPSTKACDVIKDWNEKYEWPKLRSALASDFMVWLEEYHKDDIPEKKVAWPDWWTDGVASAANETKVARTTQHQISGVTGILAMTRLMGNPLPPNYQSEVEHVYDNLLFYHEHTHGAAESVSDPLAQNTINQWGMKSAYAWEASKKCNELEEKAMAFMEAGFSKNDKPVILLFNTLNWPRSGMAELFIPNEVIPEGAVFIISDEAGHEVPWQRFEQRMEGAYYGLWVEDIPPMGYKTLVVDNNPGSESLMAKHSEVDENKWYKLSFDPNQGIITSLFDKELGIELIDQQDTLTMGQMIYERLNNRHEMERLTATTRDTIYKPLGLKRDGLKNRTISGRSYGSIYNSIFVHGELPECADERGIDIEIRLYHYMKKIEFLYSMHKLGVTDPESVYVSFPLFLENGEFSFEVQGGIVQPGINQLEGTASDWNTIQNFASVRNGKNQIVFVSDEIPLVQFGDINTGHYYYRLKPKTNHIFSWVLNNYWVTNFKASQEGELRWTYSITSMNDPSNRFATQFGWSERVPILSRVVLPATSASNTIPETKSLLELNATNLLLVNSYPSLDNTGIILHIRELEGDHAILDIRQIKEQTGATGLQEVNIYEEIIQELNGPLLFEHFETKFIKISLE